MIRVVTTMNENGWNESGERMLESFRAQWPADIEIVIYAEGFDPPEQPGVMVRRLPAWLDEFKKRHANNIRPNGQTLSRRYDYRFDAVKFSHKVAALTEEGMRQSEGILIWLDADTFTHAPVTKEWLHRLFPAPSYVAWLDRENCYPECGFVMFRCDHRSHRDAMEAYRALYVTDALFRYAEWHDSYIFQQLILGMVRDGSIEPPVSLSGDRRWSHPFVNGPLGACMDHMKGDRKSRGRSDRRDMRFQRPEPYWQARA